MLHLQAGRAKKERVRQEKAAAEEAERQEVRPHSKASWGAFTRQMLDLIQLPRQTGSRIVHVQKVKQCNQPWSCSLQGSLQL